MERAIDPLLTIDAKLWADEFMATKQRLGDAEFDHAMMLGWFANAIMQGYDEGQRRAKADTQATVEALQREHTQLQALVRALPDCPGEIKVYPPAVGGICGTYDVRYDFRLESGSFQSIRLAMFHDECEADTYADLLKYRATLDATTPAKGKD